MLTDMKPNHQADYLYTEADLSKNSHLQAEPLDDRQLLKEKASKDSDTLDFDYLTDFGGDKALIEEASKVSKSFVSFLRRTFKDLTQLGDELWGICNKCVDSLGKTEGKEKFNRWLSSEFGNSQNLARTAMSLSQWYNSLRPAMQRVVAKNVKNWSVAALKKLTSLTDELVAVLVKSGKQTAKSIERAIATSLANELAPLPAEEGDRPITPSDWSNLRERFNLRPRHIKVLKQKAESLASLSTETAPVVKVSHVNEAIAQCKKDPELLSKPPAKKAKKNKIDSSTPAESPLQDNSDEAITELIASAIASDLEKEQAANSQTIALLQQAIAEKDAAIAAQKEQINSAIASELEKAARVHQEQMESLRQTLGVQSPPVEGMYTQEQLDEAVEKKIADAYKNMYTDEEVQEEIEFELRKERIEHQKEFDAKIAEARAEILESADTTYAAKLASLEQALAEKERALASLEEQQATVETEKFASLQKELAEKEQALASLEEQTTTAVAHARADEQKKMALAYASKLESLQKELAEKNQALASSLEEKTAAVAEARADEQAVAWGDIRVLQEEIKMLKAENHSLQTTKEQLATACGQVEELKSQLTDSENKYKEKVRWLENDLNTAVKRNQDNGQTIKLLEKTNESMHHANHSLKDELAGYKNIEKKIQLNYHKINQAEKFKEENAKLKEALQRAKENLQGQMDQSVLLASRVTQLNNVLNEILFLQQTLAKQGIPGCFKESYVSPQDGQEYQGVKGVVKLIQDLVSNNNFNLKTT